MLTELSGSTAFMSKSSNWRVAFGASAGVRPPPKRFAFVAAGCLRATDSLLALPAHVAWSGLKSIGAGLDSSSAALGVGAGVAATRAAPFKAVAGAGPGVGLPMAAKAEWPLVPAAATVAGAGVKVMLSPDPGLFGLLSEASKSSHALLRPEDAAEAAGAACLGIGTGIIGLEAGVAGFESAGDNSAGARLAGD